MFFIYLILSICASLAAQSTTTDYCNMEVRDYTYKDLLNEGITTLRHQLEILNVPIKQFKFVIKWHINRHNFALNEGNRRLRKTTFRAIAYTYPSVSPKGDTIMLSGLVTMPILNDNKPNSVLVYHRIVAPSYTIAPSNSLPIEAILTADNTVCVFPDYYGCGITEGEPFAYTALNYHARCATDCVLAALKIIKDEGIELNDDYYTWNVGYSQGGGYALSMHKYIETSLPDSLASKINLKWSLCGDGVYIPIELYKNSLATNNMGSTPAIYLEGLRSIFYSHKDCLSDYNMSDFFSDEALNTKLDSLLLNHDDSLWDMVDRLDELVENKDPRYYFAPMVLDTCSAIFKAMAAAFDLDDCAKGWHPSSTVVLYHSKRDKCIPYKHVSVVYPMLSENDGDCCLYTPVFNGSHVQTSVLFYAKFLRLREDKLFKKYTKSKNNK